MNPWPLPGAIHMWIMRAFGAGARMVCTYRYRQPLFGSEEYHKGLVETDGVTPSPGGREYAQAMRDVLATARANIAPNAQAPADYAARRTAFLISFSNRWDIQNHKQTDALGHHRALDEVLPRAEEHDGAGGRGHRGPRPAGLIRSWWRPPTNLWTRS